MPTAFVGAMVLGFALALSGLALPFVEPAILASVVVLGLLAAVALHGAGRRPAWRWSACFALFHGYAHGGELGAADALVFGIGFAASTALLHACRHRPWPAGLGSSGGAHRRPRHAAAPPPLAGLWLAVGA